MAEGHGLLARHAHKPTSATVPAIETREMVFVLG